MNRNQIKIGLQYVNVNVNVNVNVREGEEKSSLVAGEKEQTPSSARDDDNQRESLNWK